MGAGDRNVWRAYKAGLVRTVTRVADGSGWTAVVEGPNITERSPAPLPTRIAAQRWAANRSRAWQARSRTRSLSPRT